ncbi:MAG: cyclodeaminase/cyclohydrolase family protein [Solirubrobacterales bacterium]|nr:cyclodeaminase/cyclohydrolase family protein [Solirubrobacterales bacterium]
MALEDRTLADVLAQIAAREPAPGGGTAAAVGAATGAALVEMAAGFALRSAEGGERRPGRVRDRARALRAELLTLAEADLSSYRPVLEALALDRDSPRRVPTLRAALSAAAMVPLAIAAGAAEVAELGVLIAGESSRELIGDAVTAVLLAEAATCAASKLVELNLRTTPEDKRLGEAQKYAARAAAARAEALAAAR